MAEEIALRVSKGDKVRVFLTKQDTVTASNCAGGEYNIVLLNKVFENEAMVKVCVEGGGVGDQS